MNRSPFDFLAEMCIRITGSRLLACTHGGATNHENLSLFYATQESRSHLSPFLLIINTVSLSRSFFLSLSITHTLTLTQTHTHTHTALHSKLTFANTQIQSKNLILLNSLQQGSWFESHSHTHIIDQRFSTRGK